MSRLGLVGGVADGETSGVPFPALQSQVSAFSALVRRWIRAGASAFLEILPNFVNLATIAAFLAPFCCEIVFLLVEGRALMLGL